MPWYVFMLTLRVFWRRMGLLLLANVLWLLLSLPLLTWPAATAGLFHLVRRVADEELLADPSPATLRDFWHGFRSYWRRTALALLIDLAAIAVIAMALRFYGGGEIEGLSWLVGPLTLLGAVWVCAQLYLLPLLLQRGEASPLAVAREAALIAISYPLTTVPLLVLVLVLAAVATLLAGPILLIFFALLALIETMALRFILSLRGEVALTLTPEQRHS